MIRSIKLVMLIVICGAQSHAQVEAPVGEFHPIRTVQLQLINVEQAIAYCATAQDQYLKENYKTAIKFCNKALEIDPCLGVALRLRGYAKIMIDSVASGCVDLQRAAQLGESSMWGEVASKHYERYCKQN